MQRPDLADELIQRAAEDLEVRQRLLDAGELAGGYNAEMRVVHRRNGDRLEVILAELGHWPGRTLVGDDGCEAAFLIAVHDIANPALMRRAHEFYGDAVDKHDADPGRLANLEDRIRYFEGRPQKYGTHMGWDTAGQFGPWPPIEEPERVDELRAVLGLDSIADAIDTAMQDARTRRTTAEVVEDQRALDEFAIEVGWRR